MGFFLFVFTIIRPTSGYSFQFVYKCLNNNLKKEQNELGFGRMERRPANKSSSEDSRAGRTAGQTEERKAAKAVSA